MAERRQYRRKGQTTVVAVRLGLETDGFTYHKWGGAQRCKAGDWLVDNGGKLEIVQTFGAGTPMTDGKKALMTIDVWEHAYYLDYQNRRPDFVKTFLDSLVDWNFAAKNLG